MTRNRRYLAVSLGARATVARRKSYSAVPPTEMSRTPVSDHGVAERRSFFQRTTPDTPDALRLLR